MLGKLIPVILLGALVLAGCATPAAETPASVKSAASANLPRPDVQAPKLLPPILLGAVTLGSEPSVAVAPDGTVYVVSPSVGAWRSDDAGKTFKTLGKAACGFGLPACPVTQENDANGLDGGGDASFATLPDGSVVSAGLGGNTGSIPFQISHDKGQSWTKGLDVAKGNSSDREWIVANKTGSIFVSWRDFGNGKDVKCGAPVDPLGVTCTGPKAGVYAARSDDGGVNWTMPIRVGDDGHEGPIAIDPTTNDLFLPHVVGNNLVMSRSADAGARWEEIKIMPLPQGDTFDFPIAAVDNVGTVYVVWNMDPSAPNVDPTGGLVGPNTIIPQVFLATSKDHGASWSKPVQVSPKGVPALFPWSVAGDAGRIAIVWYEGVQPIPSDRVPNQWNVALAMSTTADAEKPVFKESFATNAPVHVGPICTEGGFCTVTGNDRSLLDFFEVRMLPDGSPVLAFVGDNDVKEATVKIFATRMTTGTSLLEMPK